MNVPRSAKKSRQAFRHSQEKLFFNHFHSKYLFHCVVKRVVKHSSSVKKQRFRLVGRFGCGPLFCLGTPHLWRLGAHHLRPPRMCRNRLFGAPCVIAADSEITARKSSHNEAMTTLADRDETTSLVGPMFVGETAWRRGLLIHSAAGSSERAMPRFILLEHTGAPDDPAGLHYDLLLEAGDACRTWRLAALPTPAAPAVSAVELPPHRLAWLDHVAGPVSGGRGFAQRMEAGTYRVSMNDMPDVMQATRLSFVTAGSGPPHFFELAHNGDQWGVRRHVDNAGSPQAQ